MRLGTGNGKQYQGVGSATPRGYQGLAGHADGEYESHTWESRAYE
jgi:hypothetical protein